MTARGARAVSASGTNATMRELVAVTMDDILIGRDVLELVSSAMYIDPMTIYREYVQNAADAIDEARQKGILSVGDLGRVAISFETTSWTVRIQDNGVGIGWRTFVQRLSALGASGKRGTRARGFRGVGRLAGLGYAQELIFRSRIAGERRVSEMRWDCRRLRSLLRGGEPDTGVGELVRNIVEVARFESDDYPDRFFEVELKGMVRLRSDKLVSPAVVAEYLAEVAPVPFSPSFRFADQINEALKEVVDLGELDIRVEGVETPVYRPHRDVIVVDERRSVSFERLEILRVPNIDGDLGGIGWVLHHDYEGALPANPPIKGLRLRAGNIQVGDNALLEELFPEQRFNAWSVGEVHVIDRRIVPNGRRDHFEQNAHFHNLVNHLAPTAREIARLCRSNSVRRKWTREFEVHRDAVRERIDVIEQGSLATAERRSLALTAEQGLMQMEKIAGMDLLREDGCQNLQTEATALRSKLSRAMDDRGAQTSPLARLPKEKRVMYEHLFALIYECSANRVAAKSLVDRILIKIV